MPQNIGIWEKCMPEDKKYEPPQNDSSAIVALRNYFRSEAAWKDSSIQFNSAPPQEVRAVKD
jgi:hypothetical protein